MPLALLLLAPAPIARAQVDTLEWLVTDADVVVIASVTDYALKTDFLRREGWEELTLHVTRTFKSPDVRPPDELTVVKPRFAGPTAESLKRTGERMLYILFDGARARDYLDRDYLAGKLHLRTPDLHLIRLGRRLEQTIFSSDFGLINSRDQLFAAIEHDLADHRSPTSRPTAPIYLA